VVCGCGAYRFPHRMMGGRCSGGAFVDEVFETRRDCRNCHFLDTHSCEVVDGREATHRCPSLEEFIRFNNVKLYGANRGK